MTDSNWLWQHALGRHFDRTRDGNVYTYVFQECQLRTGSWRPVNSWDKTRLCGRPHSRRYIAYGSAHRNPNHHALSGFIPRRSAVAPPGVGGRWPSRQAEEGRARVEGAVAVQPGEDALILRE